MFTKQRGFTFIEILVVLGVGGILMSGIVIGIFQTFNVTKRNTMRMTALENVKNTAYHLSKDIRQAGSSGSTNLESGGASQSNLSLNWITGWYDESGNLILVNGIPTPTTVHRITYTTTSGSLERVYGSYSPGGDTVTWASNYPAWAEDPTLIDAAKFTWDSASRISRFLTDIDFSRSAQGNIIVLSVTSSPEGRPETAKQGTYHLYLQPQELPVQ